MARQGHRHLEAADRAGSPLRVVVADDDAFFREVLVATLEVDPRLSVVDEAEDGLATVALVSEHTPDLVVLDLAMPRLDGIAVARELRDAHPQLGIVMCSGDAARRSEAMRAGVDRWVGKPADRDTLLAALLDVADHREEPAGLGAQPERDRDAHERRRVDGARERHTARGAEAAE